jgi:hypothetical protein
MVVSHLLLITTVELATQRRSNVKDQPPQKAERR